MKWSNTNISYIQVEFKAVFPIVITNADFIIWITGVIPRCALALLKGNIYIFLKPH